MRIFLGIIFIVAGFLLGGVYFSKIIARRVAHKDVCSAGEDGNPGAANAFRACGLKWGIVAFALDFFKGFIPVFTACLLFSPEGLLLPAIIVMPVLGSAAGIFNHMHGGKSISVTFGVLAGTLPVSYAVLILIACYLLFTVALKIRPNGLSSIISFTLTAVLSFSVAFAQGLEVIGLAYMLVCGIVVFMHAKNIRQELALYRQRKSEDEKTFTAAE